jgi:hypothetical protein
MRTMRAAGAALLLTLALGGTPVAAQSSSMPASPTWAAVTSTGTCAPPTGGTQQLASAPYAVSGAVFACTDTASDARVTGHSTMTYNMRTSDPRGSSTGFGVIYNGTMWVDYMITGPDGTWSGRGYGVYDNDGVLHVVAMLAGDGAYDGLTYSYSATVPAGSLTAVAVGVIQPGSVPPPALSR